MAVLPRIAHALVSIPRVYDLVQTIAGQRRMARRLRQTMATMPAGPMVDVGSSGGGLADRLGVEPVYVDIDLKPLLARRRRAVAARLVGADAARLPFSEASFEVALCFFVSHHLDDATFRAVVGELARVTKGVLFFADPVRNERRLLSRLLWRYDRGRHPRTRAEILAVLGDAFEIVNFSDYKIFHQYVLCVAHPAGPRKAVAPPAT